jgi:hypothetical protein
MSKAAILNESSSVDFFHGSNVQLSVGEVLLPSDNHEKAWGENCWYRVLENNRPKSAIPRSKAVFMCDNPDDIDMCGGHIDHIFKVKPLGQ